MRHESGRRSDTVPRVRPVVRGDDTVRFNQSLATVAVLFLVRVESRWQITPMDGIVAHRVAPVDTVQDEGVPGGRGDAKAEAPSTHTRCHVITGWADDVDQQRIRSIGITGVVGKPFRPQDLLRTWRKRWQTPRKAKSETHQVPKAAPGLGRGSNAD